MQQYPPHAVAALKEIKETGLSSRGLPSQALSPSSLPRNSNMRSGLRLPVHQEKSKRAGASSRERTASHGHKRGLLLTDLGKSGGGGSLLNVTGESEQAKSFHTIQAPDMESRFKRRSEFTKKYQNYFKETEARGKDAMQTTVSTVTPVGRANVSIFSKEEY